MIKDSNISKRLLAMVGTIALFFILFYRSGRPGLNWFLFALGGSILAYIAYKPKLSPGYYLPAVGLIITGFSVFNHGTWFSMFASVLIFAYLGVAVVHPSTEPGAGILLGMFNILVSPFAVIIRFFQGLGAKDKSFKKFVGILVIPTVLVILFGTLYYQSSQAFKELVDLIRWNRLPEIIGIIVLGLFAAATLLYAYVPEILLKKVSPTQKSEELVNSMGGKNLADSWLIGVWSVIGLLALVIILDISSFNSAKEFEHFTYAGRLHQAVYSSIFSIVLAAVLAILTTNYLNPESKTRFKRSNAVFLGLNLVFIGLNFWHNANYIATYGLTERRLTIYFYLLLATAGLVISLYAIFQDKSLRFLYRSNAFMVFAATVMLTTVNWDRVITRYNVNHPYGSKAQIDFDYLLTLDHSNIPILMSHKDKMTTEQWTQVQRDAEWIAKRANFDDFRSNRLEDSRLSRQILNHPNYKTIK